MRIALAALALGAAACSQTGGAPPPAPAPRPPGACDAAPAQVLLGRTFSAARSDQARRLAGASTSRVIRPGQMVTMEFRADRLNLHVDAGNRIERIVCG